MAAVLLVVAPASAQSLSDVVQRSLTLYPGVLSANSKVEATRAEIDRARAAHYPQVGLSYANSKYASGSTPAGTNSDPTPTVKLNLWSGGRIEAEAQRAEALTEQSTQQARNTRDEAALTATEAYINWARALEMTNIAERNKASLQLTLDDIVKIVKIDIGRRIDLEQANVRMESASLQLVQRQNELAQARQRLARFWPEVLPPQPSGLDSALATGGKLSDLPASAEEAMAMITEDLPALAGLKAQVEADKKAIEVAKAQYWPTVDLVYSKAYNSSSLRYEDLTQVQLNMSVYSGGSVAASVEGAVGQLKSAQYSLDEARLVAKEKVNLAWQEWQTAKSRIVIGSSQAKVGDKVVEGYRLQFRLARRSLLDLLNIQAEAYGYQSSQVTNVFDEYIARARLLGALGELAKRFA